MDQPLEHDKNREASPSIRGYVYQAYQSVLAWMRLGEEEVLFLEAAEDFDVYEPDSAVVTQVKDIAKSGSITLRSPDVIEAINNYWHHKQLNPRKTIHFRFLTTASAGQEKGMSFGEAEKGIDYWMLLNRDEEIPVKPLRDFLLALPLDESLKVLLRTGDDKSVREDLVLKIQWDTSSKPKDGLIADIEERLINHGDRKGVDSFHSRKALDSFLRKIVDLLSTDKDRHLTYADFCVAFDETTMELMPRGEAAALRSIVNQLSSKGKNLLLTNLLQVPRILDNPLPLAQGVATRDELVKKYLTILRRSGALFLRGSTGLGKTSLARLITDEFGGDWAWANFRGRSPLQIADLLNRVALEISTFHLTSKIVLDDLDFGGVAMFERAMLSFVFSIVNSRGSVVITGPSFCPPNLLSKLWLSPECDQEVPYLSEKDVGEIALFHGLEVPMIEKWSRLIWLTTQGHPQFVHARIRNLQNCHWPPIEEMTWFKGDDLQTERDAIRLRLANEIPSDGARSLAYRLSLIAETFSRKVALTVASLLTPIPLPGENFDLLVGPWIERVGDDKYRVSPLLLNQGNEILATGERNTIHEAIALEILEGKTLVPSDVGTVLSHALSARSEKALFYLTQGLLMTAEPKVWQAIGDTVFWFTSLGLEPGQQIFRENAFIDLMLRLSQYRVAAVCKQIDKAHAVIDRTFEVLQKQRAEVAVANTAIAYLIFLITIEIPIPPRRSIDMLSCLMDISKSKHDFGDMFESLMEKRDLGFSSAGFSPTQILFTLEVARITGLDYLKELLEALNDLNAEKRKYLLAALESREVTDADLLITTAWFEDVSKDRLDIRKSINILRFAVEVGRAWKTPKLVRAAYVAISVIHDEYEHVPEAALAILDEAVEVVGENDPRLLNQRAKVLLNLSKNDAALELFERALKINSWSNIEQTFTARSAGIAAGRIGNWAKAEVLFLRGKSIAVGIEHLRTMAVGLLADAAFAVWKQGKTVEALKLYSEVLKQLEAIPINNNLKNRYLHATVRHSLLWIFHSDDDDELNISEPWPGFCSNQEPHEGFRDLEIKDMSMAWGLLGSVDAKLGTGLELAKLATERAGEMPLLMSIMQRISRYQALFKNINTPSAVHVIISMNEAHQYEKPIEKKEIDGWTAQEIPSLSPDYWESVENRERLLHILLAVAITTTCYGLTSPIPLTNWKHDLMALGIKGIEIEEFIDIISGCAQPKAETLLQNAADCLYRLREQSLAPKDLFTVHFRLLNFLASGEWGQYSGKPFADLLSRQWQYVVDHQTFAITAPTIYVSELREICVGIKLSGYSKAASILEVAASATGVRVSKSALEFLSKVKKTVDI